MKTNRTILGPSETARTPGVSAFTLVEVMIVATTIALLAVIAVPAFFKARTSSQNSVFIANLRLAKNAFIQYSFDNRGRYPPDVTPAIMPAGMTEYLGHFPWTVPTTIGGYWDFDHGQFGTEAGVSVYEPTVPVGQMRQIDEMIDNGDLATGTFKARPAGYISIME
jgi:type II secretory pathway pseudopilin PulG